MKDLIYNLGGFLHLLTWKDIVIMTLVFLILILLLVIYYLVKVKEVNKDIKIFENTDNELDLEQISKKLEAEEPRQIKLTDYEEEQEGKAIISYQELLERSKTISFDEIDDEYQNFEVKIKKINLDEIGKENQKEQKPKEITKVPMISDDKETDFLLALKKLQSKLSK